MKVKSVTIDGLYGKHFHLTLNEDITFLYGMNGCGKTTVLNILHSIISGHLTPLYQYKFSFLSLLALDPDGQEQTITVRQSSEGYVVRFRELEVLVPQRPRARTPHGNTFADVGEDDIDEGAVPAFPLKSLREAIGSLFRLVYLPLTRRDASLDIHDRFTAGPGRLRGAETSTDQSVRRAAQLVSHSSQRITHYENRILERLKEEVLKKALLTYHLSPSDLATAQDYLTEKDRADISAAISGLRLPIDHDLTMVAERLEEYRSSFTMSEQGNLDIRSPIGFANYVAVASQIRRFYEIAASVRRANDERTSIRQPLTDLLEVINQFLLDGDKEVFIDESEPGIMFRTRGTKEGTPISQMSSGEKQIVIFFVYAILALDRSRPGIFMVDEPELSLHLEWQHKFVPSLISVAPGIQYIFATHSPEIIGSMTSKCVEVRGKVNG